MTRPSQMQSLTVVVWLVAVILGWASTAELPAEPMFDRAVKTLPFLHADLDNTTSSKAQPGALHARTMARSLLPQDHLSLSAPTAPRYSFTAPCPLVHRPVGQDPRRMASPLSTGFSVGRLCQPKNFIATETHLPRPVKVSSLSRPKGPNVRAADVAVVHPINTPSIPKIPISDHKQNWNTIPDIWETLSQIIPDRS